MGSSLSEYMADWLPVLHINPWYTRPITGLGCPTFRCSRAQQVNELLVAQPLCRAINPDRRGALRAGQPAAL